MCTEENIAAVQNAIRENRHITYRQLEQSLHIPVSTSAQKMLSDFLSGTAPNVNSVVTGDESWLYFYDVPTKCQSKVWVFEDEEQPTQVKKSKSVGKRMIVAYFGKQRVIQTVVLEKQKTVTSNWYITICLPQLFEALKNLRPSSGLRSWFLHHDNAPAQRAAQTTEFLQSSGIKILEHPPYSPDLAPCDF